MLRRETRARARALQILYAWELQGKPALDAVAGRVLALCARRHRPGADAHELAVAVVEHLEGLDAEIAAAADHWRLDRLGAIERNILRLGLHELVASEVPPRVVIDEAVRLARWFAGAKAPAFVNGVLDALARRHGRL